MRFLKWALPVAIVVAALGAVVWFADLGGGKSAQAQGPSAAPAVDVEGLIASKTGLSLDTIHKLETAALAVASDKATAKGYVTPDQASKLRNVAPGPILNRVVDAVAGAANTPGTDLLNGLQNGQSLTTIAAAHGVDRATLKTNLTNAVTTELNTDKSAGLVNDVQIGMITGLLNKNIDKLIDAAHTHGTSR